MCVLKQKFEEWKIWLSGDDRHSIGNQIRNMTWDAAVFQLVNEARRYAQTDDEGNPKLNDMVHGFINHSFFVTQALAIRRLLDKETREGERSVFSLYRLVHDLEQNCSLLTRKNILDALGYPYDYEKGLRKLYEMTVRGQSSGSLMNCKFSKSMHNNIDSLTGVNSHNRSPDNTVMKQVLEWLEERLKENWDIYDYVNKFLAHSATPESRQSIKEDDIKMTLGNLIDAHQIICETAEFVSMNILNQGFGNFLVITQDDQLKHFEKPWVSEGDLKNLYDFWKKYDGETKSWVHWEWQKDFNEYVNS